MKIPKISIGLFAVISVITIFSCSKNSTPATVECFNTKRLYSRYAGQDSTYDTIYYDSNKRITRFDRISKKNRIMYTYVYTYTSTNKISTLTGTDSSGNLVDRTEYLYNSSDLVERENYYLFSGVTPALERYYTYEYYPNGNLKTRLHHKKVALVFVDDYKIYFTEYDANGNNTKGYSNNALGVTVDSFFYTYDDKKYPLKFVYEQTRYKNNFLSYREKYPSAPDYIVNYTYTYTTEGYPLKRNYTNSNGGSGFEDYNYFCE